MGFLAAIASLAVPMVARVLMAMGFSVVTITGISLSWTTVKDAIINNLGAATGAYMQLAGLGGAWVGLGAIVGAMSFVVSFKALTAATKIVGAGG